MWLGSGREFGTLQVCVFRCVWIFGTKRLLVLSTKHPSKRDFKLIRCFWALASQRVNKPKRASASAWEIENKRSNEELLGRELETFSCVSSGTSWDDEGYCHHLLSLFLLTKDASFSASSLWVGRRYASEKTHRAFRLPLPWAAFRRMRWDKSLRRPSSMVGPSARTTTCSMYWAELS